MLNRSMVRISRMKKRTRRFLIAIAILAALAGWWWLGRPQEMRLVSVRPLALPFFNPYFRANTDYLLASSSYSNRSLMALRWDGTVRWHIVPPEPVLPATCADYSRKSDYSISPSGRFYTALIVSGNSQRVMLWDEGRLVGSVSLPLTTKMRKGKPKPDTVLAQTTTLDNGQVFCRIRNAPGGDILLIEKGKIRAQGKLPVPPTAKYGIDSWQILPDGRALIAAPPGAFAYYRIMITGNALGFTPVYTAKDKSYFPFITHDGFLVTDSGAVYDEHGRISGSTGWHLLIHPFYNTLTSRHSAVLQVQSMDIGFIPFHFNGIRVLDPRTGEAWRPSKRVTYQFCQSTFDGRYLLAIETPADLPKTILYWLWDKRLIPDKLYDRKDRVRLYIYRKPGRLCASLPIVEDSGDFSIRNPRTGQWLGVWPLSLSEDGHTVRCLCYDSNDSNSHYYILTYKWR